MTVRFHLFPFRTQKSVSYTHLDVYKRQVHVLGEVVGIVEVDQTLLMCLYDLRVQQQTGGQILGDVYKRQADPAAL